MFEADVTRAEDCQAAVDAAVARYGPLHILFNNVGIIGGGGVVDVSEEQWDRVLDVNLKSMMLTSKYTVPRMAEAGDGSIINVSSVSALRAGNRGASVPYSASKGGVIALTTAMAVDHGRDNIRVNCIAPGRLYTPMASAGMSDETRDLRRRAGPQETEGTAWDIAWAALSWPATRPAGYPAWSYRWTPACWRRRPWQCCNTFCKLSAISYQLSARSLRSKADR